MVAQNSNPVEVPFCSLPFSHLNTNPNGDVRVCCYVERPIGNFQEASFDEIWNSSFANEVRESIFDQSFAHCDKRFCSIAAAGDVRLLDKPLVVQTIDRHRQSYAKLPNPELITLQHDDSCNLSCPSCRSQLIYAESERQERLINIQNGWMESPTFTSARRMVLSGNGDPFASKVYIDFLQNIRKEKSPDLEIALLTNGQLLDRKRWRSIKNAHYAIRFVLVSIDAATADTYQIVRRGGQFAKLMRNLEFISKLRKDGEIDSFTIKFVTSAVNFFEMPAFVELGKKLGCDQVKFQLIVKFSHLSDLDYSAVAVHHPKHRHHSDFLEMLQDPIFDDPIVNLVNFHSVGEDNFSFVEKIESVMEINNIHAHGEDSSVDSTPTERTSIFDRLRMKRFCLPQFLFVKKIWRVLVNKSRSMSVRTIDGCFQPDGLLRTIGRHLPSRVQQPIKSWVAKTHAGLLAADKQARSLSRHLSLRKLHEQAS